MKLHEESPDLEEAAVSRLLFLVSLRKHLHARLGAGNRHVYALRHARPDDAAIEGERATARRREVQAQLEAEPYFQCWSSTLRASQDLMWRYIGSEVDRDMDRLRGRYAERHAQAAGSVHTDPAVPIPAYLAVADTHRMPGSYFADREHADLRAGAMYDVGGAIYQLGIGNDSGRLLNDSRGRTVVSHLRQYFADLRPARIVDLGCGVGHNTVPLAESFPEAEIVGVDIGAAMLRFAHLRAEGLGARVNFVQANAECTGLPAASFDLVVSQIVLHETSPEATVNIVSESARLLRPGGIAIHLEVPVRYRGRDVFDQFLSSWEQYYNAESNIEGVATADLAGAMQAAGFTSLREGYQPIPPAGTTNPAPLEAGPTRMGSCWYVVSGMRGPD